MGYDNLLTAGIVLAGGTVQLDGFADLTRRMLRLPVRVGLPGEIGSFIDLPPEMKLPEYATALGLLLLAVEPPFFFPSDVASRGFGDGTGVFHRFLDFGKRLFPKGEG